MRIGKGTADKRLKLLKLISLLPRVVSGDETELLISLSWIYVVNIYQKWFYSSDALITSNNCWAALSLKPLEKGFLGNLCFLPFIKNILWQYRQPTLKLWILSSASLAVVLSPIASIVIPFSKSFNRFPGNKAIIISHIQSGRDCWMSLECRRVLACVSQKDFY